MDVVEQRQEVSPTELLDIRERVWSKQLLAVSLVAEYVAPSEFTEQTLGVLGQMYRRAYPHSDKQGILRRWPAVQVLSTVGVATDHYEHGTFWPKLLEIAGFGTGQTVQSDWGGAFLANLDRLDLPNFADSDDAGARFVGRILMHSGVPTYCLGDYYSLITEQRRRRPGMAPAEFVSWAASRVAEGRLPGVDKPVARFLRYGGEYAADVSDRIFELLDIVSSGGDGSDVPLPERFKVEALRLREAGRLDRLTRVRASPEGGVTEAALHPHLILDPYGRGPLLRLPAVSDAPDGLATWRVTIGARMDRVRTQALWPGANEPAPQTDVPVISPVRLASVALEGHEQHQSTISIVDDKDPLLAFGEDGKLLPRGLPLAGTSTWLLFPGPEASLSVQGDFRVIAEGALPPGWAGWSLLLVDLSGATSVSLNGEGSGRAVRRFSAARITVGDPIAGLRSRGGAAVFSTPPDIVLPTNLGEGATWDVSITDQDGHVLVRHALRGSEHSASPWDGLPRPLFGSYTVRVRGPWGRGVARELVLAEGLHIQPDPMWRRITRRGLAPATVAVAPPIGMTVNRSTFELGDRETEASLSITVRGKTRAFVVQPAHVSMSYQSADTATAPTILPVPLHTEDLREGPGTLTVDIGLDAEPVLHVLTAVGSVQTVDPMGGSRNGVYGFNLARIIDTLAVNPQLRLALDAEGQLTVANVRPKRLFSEVHVTDGALRFTGCVVVDGLTAIVYATRAPWRGGHAISVTEGVASLPEHLIEAGPLLVTIRIDDPWVPASVPDWPEVGTARAVDAPGWVSKGEDEEARLSAYLAGSADFPEVLTGFERLWDVLALLPSLMLQLRIGEVSLACAAALQAGGARALDAISRSHIETEAISHALVAAGVLWVPTASEDMTDEAFVWTRRSAVTSALLSSVSMACRRDEEGAADLYEAPRAVCGESYNRFLGGVDPNPAAGRFDLGADLFAQYDETMRSEVLAGMALVPKGLLDVDTRVQASLQLVERRNNTTLVWMTRNAHKMLSEILRVLALVGDEVGTQTVRSRMHPTKDAGWRAFSAISIGLAFVARYAARDHQVARGWIVRQQRGWADLAKTAPDLVSIDLIVAELLLASKDAESSPEGS